MGRCGQESRSTKIAGSCQSSAGRESACRAGDRGSIPGLGRSPGEGKGYLLQCSGLENSKDCIVHGVAKSWTRLSDFHFYFKVLAPLRCSFALFPALTGIAHSISLARLNLPLTPQTCCLKLLLSVDLEPTCLAVICICPCPYMNFRSFLVASQAHPAALQHPILSCPSIPRTRFWNSIIALSHQGRLSLELIGGTRRRTLPRNSPYLR